MSVHATTQTPASSAQPAYDSGYDGDRGYGWLVFAGVLLLIVGTLIEGLAAVGNAHFFTANPDFIAGSLNTWGWIVLCIGVLECAVGVGVFVKNQFARWVAVIVLAGNAIVRLMMIPAYPFWSLTILALDILAIYGLVAYDNKISSPQLVSRPASR